MPIVKYNAMNMAPVQMEGVKSVSRAIVIGPSEGWDDYVMRVFKIEPGGYTPRHKHDWEHINHVISGRGRLRIGEEVKDISEKDFALVPSNIEHQFENPNDEPFEFICIVPKKGEY